MGRNGKNIMGIPWEWELVTKLGMGMERNGNPLHGNGREWECKKPFPGISRTDHVTATLVAIAGAAACVVFQFRSVPFSSCTVSQKNVPLCHCLLSSPNINRFSKVFHWHILYTICNNTVSLLNIPRRLKCVATLRCEI